MSETAREPNGRFFEPRADSTASSETDPDAVGTTAVRSLLLGMLLTGSQDALFGLDDVLDDVALTRDVPPVRGWEDRVAVANRSDEVLRGYDVPEPESELVWSQGDRPFLDERASLWSLAAQSDDAAPALAWLRLVMASGPTTADGVAAAAALSHWRRPSKDAEVPAFLDDAREVLRRGSEAADPVVREIAEAARGTGIGRPGEARAEERLPNAWRVEMPDAGVSTMVHGTAAWRGDWWYPQGDFHDYVLGNLRDNLYAGGAPFSWSGAYLVKSRRTASERLARWVSDLAHGVVDTVFAHSYGGGITLESTTKGAVFNTAVLLSVPVHRNYDVEWRNIDRPVSVRLKFDLVLAAARARQRFPANVDELILPLYPWLHGATHDPLLWDEQDVATQLAL